MSKKILFLSALDFKEKSIQVIRKTPEAYAGKGWLVDYVVARDNLYGGNYSYEREIFPEKVNVWRFYWAFPQLRARLPRHLSLLLGKIASVIVIIGLTLRGARLARNNNYDVIYGYEMHGVLAMALLKPFVRSRMVSRFQGTFVNEMLERKQWLRLAFNLDLLLALRVRSDLTIMTDDGTGGDKALLKVRGKERVKNIRFWTNGVDAIDHQEWGDAGTHKEKLRIISISRLVGWKRVDRGIMVAERLIANGFFDFEYGIIGGGEKRGELDKMVAQLGLNDHVRFFGPMAHSDVVEKLKAAHVFFSMYDSSNVGNPLLEAIRANKLIVTLNNGDTGSWIGHKLNGLIYSLGENFYDQVALDIIDIVRNSELKRKILSNLAVTERQRLRTWGERLEQEMEEVSAIVDEL